MSRPTIISFGSKSRNVDLLARAAKRFENPRLLQCFFDSESDPKLHDSAEHIRLSHSDTAADIATKVGEDTVVASLVFSDQYLVIHSQVIDHFEIPGQTRRAVNQFRDKFTFHTAMRRAGLETFRPKTERLTLAQLHTSLEDVETPMFLKPHVGAHSRGVIRFAPGDDVDTVLSIYEEYFHSDTYAQSAPSDGEPAVLAEAEVTGEMLVPLSYIDASGEVHTPLYLETVRARDRGQAHNQIIYRQPFSPASDFIKRQVDMILQRIVDETDLRSTFIDPEFIFDEKRPYLIELNPRIGGFRAHLARYTLGVELEEMMLDLALGASVKLVPQFVKSCTGVEVWTEESGILRSFSMPENAHIKHFNQTTAIGERYTAPPEKSSAIASFYVVADGPNSLEIAEEIYQTIEIDLE